ncbi:hypothetical protein [Nocardiopsis sp. FIRDI 009]|uniref:hypothetical protein n=1 Tax=Nocardiopsis sp. FIRDI 009 TaxID=714197 RepID=UPI000E27DD75|nr:hypothetical protein [Nocardiopsis sp. FIRDI 009]
MNTPERHSAPGLRPRTWSVAAIALVLVSALPTTTANAEAVKTTTHCVITLDAPAPGSEQSRVASQFCDTDPQAAVLQDARAASTLLMTWYSSNYYNGSSTQLRGSAGPCDSSGYGVAYVGDEWNDRIGSYRLFNNCRLTTLYEHSNYGGRSVTEKYSTFEIPSVIRGRISSLWVKA